MSEVKAFVFRPEINNTNKRIVEKLLSGGTNTLILMPSWALDEEDEQTMRAFISYFQGLYPDVIFMVGDVSKEPNHPYAYQLSCLDIYFEISELSFVCRAENAISMIAEDITAHLIPSNGAVLPKIELFGKDTVYENPEDYRIYDQRPFVRECDLCPKSMLEKTAVKEFYLPILKKLLKDDRLEHSLSVAESAYKLAKRFGGNNEPTWTDQEFESAAYVAGLLHDCAKDADKAYQKNVYNLMDTGFILPSFAWHQFVSMYLAEEIFGVNNVQLLSAIGFHCTGCSEMTPLEIYVYMADKMEPHRDYETDVYWDLLDKGWKATFIKILEDQRSYLVSKGVDPETNELTTAMYDCYLGEIRHGKGTIDY